MTLNGNYYKEKRVFLTKQMGFKGTWMSIMQFVKFLMVGISNTFVSYIANVITLIVLKPYQINYDYMIANIMAFIIGTIWSYILNSKFVFKIEDGEKRNGRITFFRTFATYSLTGVILNNVLSYIWITLFGIDKLVAPIVNLIFTIPLNFIINKFWAFRAERE